MKQKILITAALPYANGPLHFGHIAGAYLPADCFARFERLRGKQVLYICGSDEYGVAITLQAELAGRTPKEHVDHFHQVIVQFFEKLGISFDHFSRTTCKEHAPLVQRFFQDLLENGYIEDKETEQLYSEADKKFLADRYVVGTCPRCGYEEARGDECGKCGGSFEATDLNHPRSKLSGAPLVRKSTRHWFLLLDRFKEKLSHFLEARAWKPNVKHFAQGYLEDLHPRAITRDLEWGVPVPLKEAQGKVFYVWFDAPIGYITATQEWSVKQGNPDGWKEYWLDSQTKYVQFMGKDNIPFHALFFPAMIFGQKEPYKVVDDLVANEFYNLEGRQFSKSEGWTIDLEDFFHHFHADQIRYSIASNAPETGDSEFTWKDFQMRCNAELLGKLGNLVNRVLVFAQNQCGGQIPKKGPLEEVDERFLNAMHRLTLEVEECFASYRLRRACQLLMEIAQFGNSYFDSKTPWKDAKTARETMETTIYCCLECIKTLALVAFPIIPSSAEKIWELLGFKEALANQSWKQVLETALVSTTPLPKPYILFQKVEDELIEKKIADLKKEKLLKAEEKVAETLAPLKPTITIDDVHKLDLRIGKIVKAEKVAKSKKLLKFEIDIGFETRTVLSGISAHYTPEELIGKKVVVVANLKPATIASIESQGMVLAGGTDSQLELLMLSDLPVGAVVS